MIIVGNGPSILDEKLGAKIDSFESVVRFNDYRIEGFQEFVGQKTTHWWNTVPIQNVCHPNLIKDYKEVCLHSWEFNQEKDEFWRKYHKLVRAETLFKSSESWVFELQKYGETSYYGFSTGLLAIWHYLKSLKSVTITGFDWWENRGHHYGDNQVIGPLHQPQEEKKIIDKLLSENKIQWLK